MEQLVVRSVKEWLGFFVLTFWSVGIILVREYFVAFDKILELFQVGKLLHYRLSISVVHTGLGEDLSSFNCLLYLFWVLTNNYFIELHWWGRADLLRIFSSSWTPLVSSLLSYSYFQVALCLSLAEKKSFSHPLSDLGFVPAFDDAIVTSFMPGRMELLFMEEYKSQTFSVAPPSLSWTTLYTPLYWSLLMENTSKSGLKRTFWFLCLRTLLFLYTPITYWIPSHQAFLKSLHRTLQKAQSRHFTTCKFGVFENQI